MDKKVVLITGASSGIGKACAKYLSSKDFRVYGTSRKASFPPVEKDDHNVIMIRMDVKDDISIQQGIDYILDKEGRIDAVVNNAGWGISGSIEDTTVDQVRQLFETNYFGQLRVCRSVIPIMRKQQKGHIINVSSIGGVLGLPFQGIYSATKFAIEGMTEALRMEVQEFGISVVLVEPGDFKTSFTKQRTKVSSNNSSSPYQKKAIETMKVVEHDEQQGSSPEKIAIVIGKILLDSRPRLRYRVGPFSQKFIAVMKGIFPYSLTQWILMKYYKLR